jgi:DNA damage-binding protein 1
MLHHRFSLFTHLICHPQIAKDFTSNWITAVEMLNSQVYLGAENWNNLFCLRRNVNSQSEEVRCRLDNIGEFHFGEMVNKFMSGSLVMPITSSSSATATSRQVSSPQKRQSSSTSTKRTSDVSSRTSIAANSPAATATSRSLRRPAVVTGSQTLFGTVDGSLGVVLGLDGRTAAFLGTLERALATVIRPVGDFSHAVFRACEAEGRMHPAHGFIDGDLVESFLDLDRRTMQLVADEMNRDGGWEMDDLSFLQASKERNKDADAIDEEIERPDLTVDDILAWVEEITMLH